MGPWDFLTRIPCYPLCGCEVMTGTWVEQPMAFWSSLAYGVVALLLSRHIKDKSFKFQLWTSYVYLLSFSSLFTHASFSMFAVAMDFASIFILFSYFAFFKRLRRLPPMKISLLSFFYFLFLILLFYSLSKWIKIGICVVIFGFSIAELVQEESWSFLKAKDFVQVMVVLLLSFGLFLIDEKGIYCDPNGILNGHTLWHLGTAYGIYLFGRWRFQSELSLDEKIV